MKKILILTFALSSVPLCAFTLYPEIADENAVFVGLSSPYLSFTDGFGLTPPCLSIEYVIPGGLPLSLGAFIQTPEPNLKHFGVHAAYHININERLTDLYILYRFDFGWIRNNLFIQYNDTPVDLNLYDFRAGVRRFFGRRFALVLETGFHFLSINLSLSLKLN